jgi:hypothetical protein
LILKPQWNPKSKIAESQRIHGNFVKPREASEGQTPADAAGIGVQGEQKWLSLLAKALVDKSAISCKTQSSLEVRSMSDQSNKGIQATSAAIVVAALVVSASILFAVSHYGLGGARTVTKTTTTTAASLMTTTTTLTALSSSSIRLWKVTFNETPFSPECYPNRWAVTLGNITLSQPSNMPFPFPGYSLGVGPSFKAISKINLVRTHAP